VSQTLKLAREVQAALRDSPEDFFDGMYGDKPDQWAATLSGTDRLRFIVNTLTRLRMCTAEGRVALKAKGPPTRSKASEAEALLPWFEVPGRASRGTRIVFGHWSTLGFLNAHGVIGLDTGCVWGGALTAVNLDADIAPVSVPCAAHQRPG
jgi:bis(5'-nucleosyl)-tetraphosphatase (symmetrical)